MYSISVWWSCGRPLRISWNSIYLGVSDRISPLRRGRCVLQSVSVPPYHDTISRAGLKAVRRSTWTLVVAAWNLGSTTGPTLKSRKLPSLLLDSSIRWRFGKILFNKLESNGKMYASVSNGLSLTSYCAECSSVEPIFSPDERSSGNRQIRWHRHNHEHKKAGWSTSEMQEVFTGQVKHFCGDPQSDFSLTEFLDHLMGWKLSVEFCSITLRRRFVLDWLCHVVLLLIVKLPKERVFWQKIIKGRFKADLDIKEYQRKWNDVIRTAV